MHFVALLALLPTGIALVTILVVVVMERRTEQAVQNVHVMLNSELAEMKRLIAVSSRAEGVQEGRLAGIAERVAAERGERKEETP